MQAVDDIAHQPRPRFSTHYSPFPPAIRISRPPRLSVMRTRQPPLGQTHPGQSTILWTKTTQPETFRQHRNPHPAPQSCCNGSWNLHVPLVTAVDCNIDDSVSRCMLGQPYSLVNTRDWQELSPLCGVPLQVPCVLISPDCS